MKDLYKQLGISSTASHDAILKALDKEIRSYIKEDAQFVLLNKNRKRVFDRCNDSLKQIGKLRANLGLNNGNNWKVHDFRDYYNSSIRSKSIIDEIFMSSSQKNTEGKKNKSNLNSYGKTAEDQLIMRWFFGFIGLMILILTFSIVISQNDLSNSSPVSKINSINITPKSAEEAIEVDLSMFDPPRKEELTANISKVPLPINGYVYNYTSKDALAPLNIKTPLYSDHYLVVLDDYYSGERSFIIFIRGGRSVEVEVPFGTYLIKYATGKEWYGVRELFGPGEMTQRFKSDNIFRFRDNGYEYTGYTIELFKQVGGNMNTRPVSESNW